MAKCRTSPGTLPGMNAVSVSLFEDLRESPYPREDYAIANDRIDRTVQLRDGSSVRTSLARPPGEREAATALSEFWWAWLIGNRPSAQFPALGHVSVADLFSGAGGMSIGVAEAARAVGRTHSVRLAVDLNRSALEVFEANHDPERIHHGPIEDLVNGELGMPPTDRERRLATEFAGLTLAIGGPPCQGHSDLNNHTRRSDRKNDLYLRMARFIEVVRPRHAIIENVPGVVHDRNSVVDRTEAALRACGYAVSNAVLSAARFGWPQRRRRHFMVASLEFDRLDLDTFAEPFASPPETVLWAFRDGIGVRNGVFDTPARHSEVNRNRIQFLFDHDVLNLPNEQRPDCHRLKRHSYASVYGRMDPAEPAPTITAGFGSTGQGRFVHPLEPRTLTPHEAARLQGFPDWYSFASVHKRGALQEMIGNAVPSRLGYVVAMGLLA